MAKLLWISDAGRPTGFGTVTHAIGERLSAMGHEIHVLAVGWDAPFPVEGPLKLYRAASRNPTSYLGYDRVVELLDRVDPDLVVLNEDAPMMLRRIFRNPHDPKFRLLNGPPIVAYLPIDGYGIPRQWHQLTERAKVVPYTKFGADSLGLDDWVHHGIDPVFRRLSDDERAKARLTFGLGEDDFVIGRVDTNSGRKDWGSTWKTITEAIEGGLPEDKTFAFFHTKLREPRSGVDLEALISKGRGKFLVTNEEDWPIEDLVRLFNCFDVFLTNTRGEGWGLNIGQALACGVPVIGTDCSSLPEVVGPGGWLYPGVARMTNPYGIELVLSDTTAMAKGLIGLYNSPDVRRRMGDDGQEHVKQFTWEAAASRFNEIIEGQLAQT